MNYSPRPKIEPAPEPEIDELEEDYESEDENPNAFKIRGALPEYEERKVTIRDLHNSIHEGSIDLEPSYQRDVVWPDSKQIGLIHSIFHNYYIPPIVFAVHIAEDDSNETVCVCVDGKQRLTSIQKFCDGQIPYKDPKTNKQWWFTLPQSSKGVKAEIPESQRERFLDHSMTCGEYSLDHTVASEKLQALSSPWAQWIRDLERQHVSVDGGLASVLDWDVKRGRDYQNIAHLVCCCDYFPDKEETPTTASITKWISREDPPTEQFKSEITKVLVDLWQIGSNEDLNEGLKSKKIGSRIAPVEFIFIGVLLFVMRKKTIEERARAIKLLRTGIRAKFKDIRTNSSVCKEMWTIIRNLQGTSSSSSSNNITKGKKRRIHEDDEDDEYRPTPIHGLNKSYTRAKKTILS
ncbi:hypothetical protein H0H87_009662 [Tephrocybe sp. NHM501043]|nr:hypothetical protein H0H87_009662 [Tephrocybe sp. NHM501043]